MASALYNYIITYTQYSPHITQSGELPPCMHVASLYLLMWTPLGSDKVSVFWGLSVIFLVGVAV